jgi:site-specific recombinase XerD
MALEQVFVDPSTLRRFREGPLASELDGFCEWLSKRGFAHFTIRRHISNVSHFSRYLEQKKLTDPASFNSGHVRRFITEHLPHYKHRRSGAKHYHRVAFSIHRFIEYLNEDGQADPSHYCNVSYHAVIDKYFKWLRDYHNSAPGTLTLRRQYLVQFLDWLNVGSITQQLLELSPDQVETFFLNYSQSHGRAARRSMQATLRTFFRFCFSRDYTPRDFAEIVPTLRTYKLDKIPRGINEEDAQRLLASINRNSDMGRRDYAIIQLLYTYGIRGGQLRALRLKDIDWQQSRIHFMALKHGKGILQPLTDKVGESLLDYLQHTRPESSYPEVFLTLRAPYRPMQYSTTLSEIIARRMRAAGITAPTYGAHAFRHRFASRMLEHGHSLKSIADMIGHRCIQTTFIYTKVDFQALNQVALDWPEEEL